MAGASFLAGVTKVEAANKINSAIIFSETGAGKTWLGASADEIEDYSPVLIVDIEGSAAGVARKYPNVDIIKVNSYDSLEVIKNELIEDEHPYKTVLFDTLNVAQNRAEIQFRALNPGNKFGVYSDLKEWTIDFVRSMHHAPFMAIFLAHAQVDKDENTGRLLTTMKLTGSSRTDVPAVPDLIGYLNFEQDEDGKPVRVLTVGGSSAIVTKNRFGIPDKIYDPTILKIQEAMIAVQYGDKDNA